ncbi:MAG: cytochrome c3 family protein [Pseudomonadota bacterium]
MRFFLGLLLLVSCACTGVNAMESYDVPGLLVTDSDGRQKSDFKPGETVRCEALFMLDAPGIAILSGTISASSWQDTLAARIRLGLKGTYNVSWTAQLPFSIKGQARIDVVIYSPLLKERLLRTAFFTITPIQAEYVGSDTCKTCHSPVYEAWSKTLHATAIGCETCHGPASEHVQTMSPENIVVDTSADLCKRCHSRNDGTVIEAEGEFIKGQQQYNEWRSTAHGRVTECSTCHNPHYSLSRDRRNAIKISCSTCHPDKSVSLTMQTLACENCHMPKAVRFEASEGSGIYRKGDRASHLWRIKPEANPEDMFSLDQKAIVQDGLGPFLTLNFTCLGCHNGSDARFEELAAVRKTATLVH